MNSPVALLAEGVDRNLVEPAVIADVNLSPSSRRAWIEISWASATSCKMFVALLAEGVDRNLRVLYARYVDRESPSSRRAWIEIPIAVDVSNCSCRPPRGGRG